MGKTAFSRRTLFQAGSLALAADLTGTAQAAQQKSAAAASQPDLPVLNRFPHMVQEYYVRRLRQIPRPSLSSRADAEAYVRTVRDKARECFGPEPARTP